MSHATTSHRASPTIAAACIATAMVMLDISVVNTALSAIAKHLSAGLGGLQWLVDAYTLPLAAVVLTAASLGGSLRSPLCDGIARPAGPRDRLAGPYVIGLHHAVRLAVATAEVGAIVAAVLIGRRPTRATDPVPAPALAPEIEEGQLPA